MTQPCPIRAESARTSDKVAVIAIDPRLRGTVPVREEIHRLHAKSESSRRGGDTEGPHRAISFRQDRLGP